MAMRARRIKVKVNVEPEQPMLSFNRICFGLMNNDWMLVASSSVKLVMSGLLFMQVYNKSI
jgi:hypothetical protein